MSYQASSTSELLKELLLSPYDAGIVIKHLEGSPLFKQLIGTARTLTVLKQQQLEEITLRNQLAAQLAQQLKDLMILKQELTNATENYHGDNEDEARQLAELRQQQEEQAKRSKELLELIEQTSVTIAALQLRLTQQQALLKETLTKYGTALTNASNTLFDNLAETFKENNGMITAISALRLKPTRTPQERKELLLKDLENPALPLTQDLKAAKERIQQLDNNQMPIFDTTMTQMELAFAYAEQNNISYPQAAKALSQKTKEIFNTTITDKRAASEDFEGTVDEINTQITATKTQLAQALQQSGDLTAQFTILQQQNSSLFERARTWAPQAVASLGKVANTVGATIGNVANKASAAIGSVANTVSGVVGNLTNSTQAEDNKPGPQLTNQPRR